MPERYRPDSARVAWSVSGAEVVLLDLERSTYLSLNDTAADLWQALADGASRAELVTHLTTTYDVAPETAATDVDEFLASLSTRGYLEAAEA